MNYGSRFDQPPPILVVNTDLSLMMRAANVPLHVREASNLKNFVVKLKKLT